MDFYLQDSRSYTGNDLMWWAKGGRGYTTDLREAEVFTRESAQRQHRARPTDIPWPAEYIQAKAKPVVDHQYLDIAEAYRNDTTGITLELEPARKKIERYRCVGCGIFMSEACHYTAPCRRCNMDNRP